MAEASRKMSGGRRSCWRRYMEVSGGRKMLEGRTKLAEGCRKLAEGHIKILEGRNKVLESRRRCVSTWEVVEAYEVGGV
ncbi:hypothetical protein FNV43_RR18700 [Rhamnella rubrinervis]|uniref:Uncharacterized protein n=1 Tax=Rhamnella rubrinervis TaxID=2594499 RepID=A0A8K0E526_9ROSA|nr:hypothetical protein FNV43_RR18700 [Rhamnella rubrinervis]